MYSIEKFVFACENCTVVERACYVEKGLAPDEVRRNVWRNSIHFMCSSSLTESLQGH